MWLSNKEWIAVAFMAIVIVPGILYYFINPHYTSRMIISPQTSDTLEVRSGDLDNEKLIIKVDGSSSEDYMLRLNLIYNNGDNRTLSHSDSIRIPAGNLNAVFTKKIDIAPQLKEAQIIYQAKSSRSRTELKLEAGLF